MGETQKRKASRTANRDRGRTASLTDEAYEVVRHRIIVCELAPGDIVTESKLAAEIGVGKTPTRDALARLASEGLVTALSRKGYEIVPLTMRDVAYLYETWRVIACEAAAMIAVRASPEEKLRLRDMSMAWAPAVPEDTEAIRTHLDSSPYGLLFELTGNPVLADMARPINALFERLMNFAILRGGWANEEFTARRETVHVAIERGDADAARDAMAEMVDYGEREVMEILRRLDVVLNVPLTTQQSVSDLIPNAGIDWQQNNGVG